MKENYMPSVRIYKKKQLPTDFDDRNPFSGFHSLLSESNFKRKTTKVPRMNASIFMPTNNACLFLWTLQITYAVYYKYSSSDTALEYPRQETLSGADNAPSAPNVVPPVPTPEPVVYYREVPPQATPNETPSSPKVVNPIVTQNSRLPLQTQTLEEFSGEPSYEDDLTSESKTTVSFNTPNMRFEIPSEFRTFLNTPPRWINLDNW